MGILDRVKSAKEANVDHMKVLIHGNSGSGKSTLCATGEGRTLYAFTEPQGVISAKRVNPELKVVHLQSADDLRMLLSELKKAEIDQEAGTVAGYRTLALDSLTEMQRLIIDEYIDRYRAAKTGDKITIAEWGEIIDRTLQMVRAFRDLPMHVVITALSTEHFIGTEENQKRLVRPDVKGKALPNELAQFFNLVGYSFKRVHGGKAQYLILFEGHEEFLTKPVPGLRYIEDPDINYWIQRSLHGGEPRDDTARMSLDPTTISLLKGEKKEVEKKKEKTTEKKETKKAQKKGTRKPDKEETEKTGDEE